MALKLSQAQLNQLIRRDTGFLAFSFPRSLGSGVYDRINGGQQKLVRIYLSYISTKFRPIWMRFGGDIAQIGAHQLLLSSINSVINSTPQGPWERKGQKTRVTPYTSLLLLSSRLLASITPPTGRK